MDFLAVLETWAICFLPLCTLLEAMLVHNKNSAFWHLHVEMKSFHDALDALVQVLYLLLVALLVEQVAHQDLAAVALDLEKIEKVHVKVPIKVYKKVTSKSCHSHVKVTSNSCQSQVKVKSKSRQSHVKVKSKSHQSNIRVTSKSCQSHIRVM